MALILAIDLPSHEEKYTCVLALIFLDGYQKRKTFSLVICYDLPLFAILLDTGFIEWLRFPKSDVASVKKHFRAMFCF